MPTLRVTMKQTWQGQKVQNTFHIVGGNATQANAQGIGDYIRSIWATNMSTYQSTSWSLDSFSARELDVVTNPTIDYTFTAGALSGGDADDVLPAQVAGLISWVAFTAKPNRGRTYLAGLTKNDVNSTGYWSGSLFAGAGGFAEDLIDISTYDPGMALAITRVNRVTGVLVGSNLVDSYVVRPIPATQRSRRRGVGA